MTFRKNFIFTLIRLFSDIIALYCAFLVFSFDIHTGASMTFSFPLFLLCSFVTALFNCLLAKKERPLLMIVLINAFLALITIFLMFSLPNTIEGIRGHVLFFLLFLYPVLRSFFLSRHPANLEQMRLYCDFSVIGTGAFLLIQLGVFTPGSIANALCVSALIINLFALSSLRMEGSKNTSASGSSFSGNAILAIFTAALVFIALALTLIIPASKDIVLSLLIELKDLIFKALTALYNLVSFLFSLVPTPEYNSSLDIEPNSIPETPQDSEETIAINSLAIIIGFASFSVAFFLFLLLRFRRMRLKAAAFNALPQKEKSLSPSLFKIILSKLKALIDKLRFNILLLFNFNTYSGVFIRLERRARKTDVRRLSSQTPREFLMALKNTLSEDEKASPALLLLADQIDLQCFTKDPKYASLEMDKLKIKALMRIKALKKHKKRGPAKRNLEDR